MSVRVRFAPSPTGLLHVGNARVALINWLFARRAGGAFLLRLDDTDSERSTAAFAAGIEEDMAWLGLRWDEHARQSDRDDRYAVAVTRLKQADRLYPCYETPEELALKRKRQRANHRPPVYDRAALALDAAARAALEAEGRVPHWRFRLDHVDIAWDDLVRGPVRFAGEKLSDPVLVRADGRPLYTLSSVVDDLELGVTHIIRGEDHVTNTALQIQLHAALGGDLSALTFAHLPLLADSAGAGLSKRLGSLSLKSLREDGIEAMAVNSLLAGLGTSQSVAPRIRLEELVAEFDIARFGRATPKFDPVELAALNARLLHLLSYEDVADRLAALGLNAADAAFWEAVRPNLVRLAEARDWWRVCHGAIDPVVEDPVFAAEAARLLPDEPWDDTVWTAWTGEIAARTGCKGRALFRPLRLALTGREHGPELKVLLPLIGRARAVARLSGETA